MSSQQSTTPLILTIVTAFVVVASIFLSSNTAAAADAPALKSAKACPETRSTKLRPQTRYLKLTPRLGRRDQIAALESVQLALSEVGDGSTYIWHRHHGKLSGAVRPTQSFKSASGQICRHIEVTMTSAGLRRSTQTIACRLKSGVWQLDG